MRVLSTSIRRSLWLPALSLLSLSAVLLSPTARVIAKQLCDPIAHATSGGAALFVLAFIGLSALMLMRRSQRPEPTRLDRTGIVLLSALLAGNAANTIAHVTALRTLELPLTVPIYQWAGVDNTYSYLFHSHAGKAALTSLLAPLAGPLSLDIGQGWGVSLPRWAAAACAATLFLSLCLYAYLLPRMAQRFANNRWIIILFGLATLNAAKGIIDGGLLSYRALPSLLVLAALLSSQDTRQLLRHLPAWLALSGVTLGIYLLIWTRWSPALASEPWVAFANYLALLALPALLAWQPGNTMREEFLRPGLHGAALVLATAVLAQQYLADIREGTGLLWKPLAADYRAVYIDARTLQLRTWQVGGKRPIDLYREAGDDPLKPRHLLLARAGLAPPAEFALAILSGTVGAATPAENPPWRLQASRVQSARADLRILSLSASTPALSGTFTAAGVLAQNNYYCLLHGLSAQLRAAGLVNFTLVPLRDRSDLDSLLGAGAERRLSASNHDAG